MTTRFNPPRWITMGDYCVSCGHHRDVHQEDGNVRRHCTAVMATGGECPCQRFEAAPVRR